MSFVIPVYNKINIRIKRTEGKYIYTHDGRKLTDFFSGLSVTNMGNCHEKIVKAICDAASRYTHISNLFPEDNQEALSEELVKRSIDGRVFFSNSGAEANECAIKFARKYFSGEKYEIISFVNSFHGRTLATLAATGQAKFKEGFGPLPEGFSHAEYNFLASVEDKITSKTCAIMVETIQGEGGVNVARDDFLKGLRKICDDNEIFLIIDEIQTGMGRTGRFLAYEHYGIKPDIITMGKALGGGLPLSATIVTEQIASAIKKGDHGSTFGGNPVACAAALVSVKELDDRLLNKIQARGQELMNGLQSLAEKYKDAVKEVRGLGLMCGMELEAKGQPLVDFLLEKGFLINCTQQKVLRFLPPYIIEKHDIDGLIIAIEEYLKDGVTL